MLEPAWGSGIEVHTEVIHQQAQRGVLPPLGARAQKAILEMPDRQIPVLAETFHPPGTGTAPPGQQGIHIALTSGHQRRRGQQLRNGPMHQQAPLRHPQTRGFQPGHSGRTVRWNPL